MVNIVKRGVQIAKIGAAARKLKNSRSDAEKLLARRALANLFADARGGVMKIGQLMAGQNDDNPFADLAAGVEPLPLAEMIPVIEDGVGCSLSDVFSEID
jgi:predicted unusual protein kinase regulating ubiquinone biosynthesis (AarF/ABC1/UbiB family)